ncbi:MAG TPA: hypothetical protein VFF16_04845 [Telluria sp.]|nr:hypothetical protein [Telluria sp.]
MFADAHPSRRWPAIALVALAHLLALLWLQTPRTARPAGPAAETWFDLLPPRAPRPSARPAPAPPSVPRAITLPPAAPAAAPAAPAPVQVAPAQTAADPFASQPVSGSFAQRLLQAAGKADAELNHGKPPVTGYSKDERLGNAIDQARAAPRFFQAPEIHEVKDPNNSGRRIYKVRSALGTYCIYVESNHALDGRDSMQQGIKPKVANCPRE